MYCGVFFFFVVVVVVLFCFSLFFKSEFLCVALTILELTLETGQASNSEFFQIHRASGHASIN